MFRSCGCMFLTIIVLFDNSTDRVTVVAFLQRVGSLMQPQDSGR